MVNRRNFLKSASFLTLGGLVAGKAEGELTKDVPAGMKQLKQMGYSTLELAGYNNGKINGVDMMEFKKMAEDAGLKITSSHVNPPTGEYTPDTRNTLWNIGKRRQTIMPS